MSKYHNRRTEIDGINFASRKEANRYLELCLLVKCGVIANFELQKRFEIVPKSRHGKALYYVADFVYFEDGVQVVEDAKGLLTPVYRLKKRLMAERYNVVIRET